MPPLGGWIAAKARVSSSNLLVVVTCSGDVEPARKPGAARYPNQTAGQEEARTGARPPTKRRSGLGIALLPLRRPARLPDAPGAAATPMPDGRVLLVGNCTPFLFFSEFKGADREALTGLETAVLGLIFLLALAANACGIALLARRKSRLRASACLVLNLFCADVLFSSAIPFILVVRWTESWTLGEAACHLLFYAMSLSGSVTILSLAAVSLERVVSIVRLRPLQPCRGRVMAAVLLAIWAFSALATLPLCLFFTVVPVRHNGQEAFICTLMWPSTAGEIAWDVCFTAVVFLIPGLVIVISYSKILQITKESRRRLSAGMAYSKRNHIQVSRQDFRLLRTLFVLMISFFVMWSPIIITILLILVQRFDPDVGLLPSVFFWIMAFTFANSVVNPVLYNVVHFKREWRRAFFCCPHPPGGRETATETTPRHNNHGPPTLSVISR
ncbi:free fatty acid receptor 4 [Heteronotia binoei]|uniref:free fatty acid receptor 4 n=1 Tax=Heteronotia binoei TaxID=13085 RepID=UPI00292F9356|nr:free fatty acid receptor 4 [Heteronotia binoei]